MASPAGLATWFPALGSTLSQHHDKLRDHLIKDGGLGIDEEHTLWHGSPWTTSTLNLGPQVVTDPHRDAGNLAYGLCTVTAIGDFNHTKGGHLVFDELRMIFEMASGDTIIFPSALLTHWNTPIQPHETRQSLVFWTCGQSIRYYAVGGRLMKDLSEDEKTTHRVWAQQQWENGIKQFLTLEELKKLTFSVT